MQAITEEIAAFRQRIKPELTHAINDYLRTQVPQSAEEKKALAGQIGDIVKMLGFAIEHDGKACSLYSYAGKKDLKGRFRIQPWDSKKPLAQAANPADLLPLQLIDTIPPQQAHQERPPLSDATTNWQQRVKGDDSESSPTR